MWLMYSIMQLYTAQVLLDPVLFVNIFQLSYMETFYIIISKEDFVLQY